jgi:vancomycin resistance protein YoaR
VLDVGVTSRALVNAALKPYPRVARIRVVSAAPELTTAEARRMGIRGLVGAYETFYGGEPNRIHNVQLVSRLLDGKLIAPRATFSFNGTTGERSAEKGFLEAPVIINGELQTGLGGGTCQVSTTVFNAAYEAGLPITARTNHALYISHYPLGRDATVNYPDTDLRFVNDTGRWLLLRMFVGPSSLTAALYGRPVHRRVVSEASPLVVTGPPPVKRISDPSVWEGKNVTVESGEPSRSTKVRRRVYSASGKLLLDNTWYSSYRGEPAVVKVGTKPRPEPKKKKKGKPKPPPAPPPPPPPEPF